MLQIRFARGRVNIRCLNIREGSNIRKTEYLGEPNNKVGTLKYYQGLNIRESSISTETRYFRVTFSEDLILRLLSLS